MLINLESETPAEKLARMFHDTYERLAPSFGYETRKETREFSPDTPNGKLMVAVCEEVLQDMLTDDERINRLVNILSNLHWEYAHEWPEWVEDQVTEEMVRNGWKGHSEEETMLDFKKPVPKRVYDMKEVIDYLKNKYEIDGKDLVNSCNENAVDDQDSAVVQFEYYEEDEPTDEFLRLFEEFGSVVNLEVTW